MDTPRNFQAGAFAGTAEAYLRYRPPYPAALLANLVAQAQLPASAVLLDLACGPGRVMNYDSISDFSERPLRGAARKPESAEFALKNGRTLIVYRPS